MFSISILQAFTIFQSLFVIFASVFAAKATDKRAKSKLITQSVRGTTIVLYNMLRCPLRKERKKKKKEEKKKKEKKKRQ